eukprot:6173465-Pleurochrysis_carterae.AAC.3
MKTVSSEHIRDARPGMAVEQAMLLSAAGVRVTTEKPTVAHRARPVRSRRHGDGPAQAIHPAACACSFGLCWRPPVASIFHIGNRNSCRGTTLSYKHV